MHKLLILVSLSLIIVACGRPDLDDSEPGARGERDKNLAEMRERVRDRPVPVAIAMVSTGTVEAFYSTTTSLTAEDEAVVVARTEGVVEAIYVEEGASVTADQPLAQLDTRKLELEVALTQTNIDSLEQAFTRASQLFDRKMISPDAHDEARFSLERERAALALQRYELSEATIRAPIDGVVTERYIKLGNTLTPNSQAFEIKRSDAIEAILNVPERELAKFQPGQFARVIVDALNQQIFSGVVDRVAPEVDANSGTFRVTVVLENSNGLLKPGMFARVSVRFDTSDDALLIARDAVLTQENETSVFVVRDGTAMRQSVKVGYPTGGQIEIRDGLEVGDQVIVTGQRGLRDGSNVRIVRL